MHGENLKLMTLKRWR